MLESRIGPYEIIGRLGEGGMGVVYRARDVSTGETVAVKTARAESHHALSSLRGEINALARLSHPSIVRIVNSGAHNGVPWYAMELLTGQTWSDFNRTLWPPPVGVGEGDDEHGFDMTLDTTMPRSRSGRSGNGEHRDLMSTDDGSSVRYVGHRPRQTRSPVAAARLPEVLNLARRLCTALTVLHNAGFVHRDLKPSNVFLASGRPVVTDFGIASRFRGAVGRERLEVSGKLVGTVHYMAPEQASGHLLDARADLYALGMMLYETLAGRLPFSTRNYDDWWFAVQTQEVPPLGMFVDGVPEPLDQLVRTLLSREPRDRLGHADDVSRALDRLGAEPDPQSPGISRPYLYRPDIAGRETQRTHLAQAIDRARAGEGGIIVISGESGVGKTVLANEAARIASLSQMRLVTGECLPLGLGDHTRVDLKSAALHPLRPALQYAADICRGEDNETYDRIFGEGRGKLLSTYEPALGELPKTSSQSLPGLPIDFGRNRLVEAAVTVLKRLVEVDGAFLLLLDDLQWADEVTIAVLVWLADHGLERDRLLVIGTCRIDHVQPALAELLLKPSVQRVELDRLDLESVGAMVRDMLALREPPSGFVSFLAKHSEGNPFFVAEYLRLAVAEGLLRRERGRWSIEVDGDREASYARLSLPASLKELIERRLNGLDPAAKEVLEVASVLGRESERSLLRTVAGIDDDRLDGALKQLAVRQIIQESRDSWRFVHDKVRETAYGTIGAERRKALNRAAAVALQTLAAREVRIDHARLAGYWSEAEVWPKAVQALEEAAEISHRAFAHEQAIRLYRNLLSIGGGNRIDVGPTRRGQWERSLADANLALGRDFEGRRHIERALAHFGQPNLPTWTILQALSVLRELMVRGLQGRWMSWFAVGPGLKRTRTAEAAYAYNRLLEHTLRNNETLLAVYANLRNVNLAERIPPRPALARGYAMLTYVACLTPFSRLTERLAQRAMQTAEALGSDETTTYVVTRLMAYQVTVGRWGEADRGLERSVSLARKLGDKKAEEEACLTRAVGLYVQGRFEECLAHSLNVVQSASERGDVRWEGFARSGAVESYVRLGRDVEVRSELPFLKRWAQGQREKGEALWAHGATALGAWHTGDEETAQLEVERAVILMRVSRPQVFFITGALWELSELCLALDERNADASSRESRRLRRQLREVVGRLATFGRFIPFAAPYALLARGGLAWREGRANQAIRLWKRALTRAETLGAAHAEARAHYELGRHADGATRERHLDRATELYESMGATPELAKAKAARRSDRVPL